MVGVNRKHHDNGTHVDIFEIISYYEVFKIGWGHIYMIYLFLKETL